MAIPRHAASTYPIRGYSIAKLCCASSLVAAKQPCRYRSQTQTPRTSVSQLTVNAIYNLEENLRYLLHLHREGQRSFRKQHDDDLQKALSQPHNTTHDRQPQLRRGNAGQKVC